jgi:hypothetical protein
MLLIVVNVDAAVHRHDGYAGFLVTIVASVSYCCRSSFLTYLCNVTTGASAIRGSATGYGSGRQRISENFTAGLRGYRHEQNR